MSYLFPFVNVRTYPYYRKLCFKKNVFGKEVAVCLLSCFTTKIHTEPSITCKLFPYMVQTEIIWSGSVNNSYLSGDAHLKPSLITSVKQNIYLNHENFFKMHVRLYLRWFFSFWSKKNLDYLLLNRQIIALNHPMILVFPFLV